MATGGTGSKTQTSDQEGDDLAVNKLTCAICLEKYRRPKLLPCYHTFCQSCIQSLVGSSASFSCPACRTVILLPTGGVAALQTNFYIEADLDTDTSSPPRRLCDVCAEDREATHTCMQCQQRYCGPCRRVHDAITSTRSHTVVALQAEEADTASCKEGAAPGGKRREEMCHKHRDQRVVLHCKACSANICIQCKLTLHEGHRTEDLVDTGAKVKAELQAMLETMVAEKRRLEAVLSAVDEKRAKLKELQQRAERGIQSRVDTLQQWLNQSRDEAVQSVQSTTGTMEELIQTKAEHIRNRFSALSAQCSHVTRVLQDDNEADIVNLNSQLSTVTLTGKDADEEKLLLPLPSLACRHDNTAVNPVMVRAFVGSGLDVVSHADPESSDSLVDNSPSQSDTAPQSSPINEKEPPRKYVYSTNKKSVLKAICPTSKDRLWVLYSPDGDDNSDVAHLKLLDDKGQVVEANTQATVSFAMITALNCVTFMLVSTPSGIVSTRWVQPGGIGGDTYNASLQIEDMLMSGATGCYYMRFCGDTTYYRVHINSVNPSTWTRHVIMETSLCPGLLRDVSPQEKYFVYTDDNEAIVFENRGPADLPKNCVYKLNNRVIDARFCLISGKEMLLAVAESDNKVHVVDYKNGGSLNSYLDTRPMVLKDPCQLITDYYTRVWIGCDDGTVVIVDL